LNFLDLFLPNKELSSADRARAFLWLMYFYLESNEGNNPFDDDYSRNNPGKAPLLRRLTKSQLASENVDSPEEISWGKKMSGLRNSFLHKLVSSIEYEKRTKASAPHFVAAASEPNSSMRRTRQRTGQEMFKDEGAFMYYVPPREPASALKNQRNRDPQPRTQPPSSFKREERTMLQHAWHSINTTDPLLDSDEENQDEHIRLDYSRRLNVISMLQRTPAVDIRGVNHN